MMLDAQDRVQAVDGQAIHAESMASGRVGEGQD